MEGSIMEIFSVLLALCAGEFPAQANVSIW